MQRSDQIDQLAAALSAAQGEMRGAAKDARNPFFNSRYADLASCWEAIRDCLAKHKLSIAQTAETEADSVAVETILMHASGQWLSSRLVIRPMRQRSKHEGGGWEPASDPQSVGSALTYARRYALQATVGIAPEDDDGNAATGREPPPPPPPPKKKAWGDYSPEERFAASRKRIESLAGDLAKLTAASEKINPEEYTPEHYKELMGLLVRLQNEAASKTEEPTL